MSWIKLDIKANEEKVYWNRRPKNFFNIPEVSCCYAIYFNDELVYIGSTNNLSNRVSQYKFKHMGNEIKTHWGYVDKNTKINIKYKTSKKYGY